MTKYYGLFFDLIHFFRSTLHDGFRSRFLCVYYFMGWSASSRLTTVGIDLAGDMMYLFSSEWNGSKVLGMKIVVIIRDEVMSWINEFSLVILMKPIINQYKSYWYCYVEVGIMLDCVGRSLLYTLKFNIAREKLHYQKERGLPTIHFQGISLFKILEYITTWYWQLMYIRYLYSYCILEKKIYIYL